MGTSEGLEVLCVSQFTLFASLKRKKGGLDFRKAMKPMEARQLYADFVTNRRF